MTTAFDVLVSWRHARNVANQAIEKATAAVDDATLKQARVAEMLRKHGPVIHNGHVYWFRQNEIVCEPCVDSLLLNLEGAK